MQTKNVLIALSVLLVLIGGYAVMSRRGNVPENSAPTTVPTDTSAMPIVPQEGVAPVKETIVTPVEVSTTAPSVKEFTMNSWMDKINGKMAAHFSLKEIDVKKGDRVRITITNTAGTHDFNIDAYGIKVETPLNEKTVVEFIADKAGMFEYYCSKYNHRDIGQTGTLRVMD